MSRIFLITVMPSVAENAHRFVINHKCRAQGLISRRIGAVSLSCCILRPLVSYGRCAVPARRDHTGSKDPAYQPGISGLSHYRRLAYIQFNIQSGGVSARYRDIFRKDLIRAHEE